MEVRHLGVVPYREGVALQEELRAQLLAGEAPEHLLLLEHPRLYTLGRRSAPGDLPLSDAFLAEQGIDVVETDRGGKLTYHGPGQLVGYPIMRVGDVLVFLRTMEGAIIDALAEAGVEAHARPGKEYTGVWVGDRKIASIGVHLSRGVSTHGFAVNVDLDLAPFSWVVACGLPDVTMTSIGAEGGDDDVARFRERMERAFCAAFAPVPSMT